ncbi:MAG: UDP-N-acetylglucosamine 2-epimerase [Vulcanimicrobiaceae bacterium]
MRKVGVVTVARSDYGIYLPILRAIEADPDLALHLIVTGAHLSPEFGSTVDRIIEDGFRVGDRFETLLSSDSPAGIAKSMGIGTMGFAQSYARTRPDVLVVLGDRFEMHAAALAALPFTIPVAHVHGGELSFGAMDDALRHSMTKLAHLHFASTRAYADRIVQLGEQPWRVRVSGAPALDHLHDIVYLEPNELEARFGLRLDDAPVLVTFHPVTLEYEHAGRQIDALLEALETLDVPIVFTMPNADTAGRLTATRIRAFAERRERTFCVDNFGTQAYFSMLRIASAMVGNSSSGIIEAASFGLPVVNVGNRQAGRLHGANVIDAACSPNEIEHALRQARSREFRESVRALANPYGSGNAASVIVEALRDTPLDDRLLIKRFYDLPVRDAATERKG